MTVVESVNVDATTDEDKTHAITFELRQNYPNPFSETTMIRFSIPDYTTVSLTVFDLLGRKVMSLVDKPLGPGSHSISLDAGSTISGVYIYRLATPNAAAIRTMLLVK